MGEVEHRKLSLRSTARMKGVFALLLCLASAYAIDIARQWPGFEKEQRYSYRYEGLVVHSIPRSAQKSVGLRLSANCHLDVIKQGVIQLQLENVKAQEVQVRMNDKEQPISQEAQPVDIPSRHKDQLQLPVQLHFNSQGLVKAVNARKEDSKWSLNMKRGLANLLQLSPKQESPQNNFVQQIERTVVGECEVSYNILSQSPEEQQHQLKVTKLINYEKCLRRVQLKQTSLEGHICKNCRGSPTNAQPIRSLGHIEYTLKQDETTKKLVIQKAVSEERHVVTPLSEQDGKASGYARQSLQYKNKDKSQAKKSAIERPISLVFEVQDPEQQRRKDTMEQETLQSKIKEQMKQLRMSIKKDSIAPETARQFSELVQNLRRCDVKRVEAITDHALQHPDKIVKKLYIDALSNAGTKEVVQVLKERATSGKLSSKQLYRVFLALPLTPYPSIQITDDVQTLCKHDISKKDHILRRHCLLAFGALVHRVSLSSEVVRKPKTINSIRQYQQFLEQQLNSAQSPKEQITCLKAIGNSGLKPLRRVLYKFLNKRDTPLHVRVECVWALRRIVPQVPEQVRSKLMPIFADVTEDPELRMAAFAILLDCDPSMITMQAVANAVKREMISKSRRSNQVASFVVSNLYSLAFSQNLATKRRSARARLALRFMPDITLGMEYSKGIRLAKYSQRLQAGIEIQANKMNVPESFFPRQMNTKVQLHLLQHKFNAFEIGTRLENVDEIIREVISDINTRQKRSIFSYFWDTFTGDIPTRRPTNGQTNQQQQETIATSKTRRPSTRPSTSRPMEEDDTRTKQSTRPTSRHSTQQSTRPSVRPTRPEMLESDGEKKYQQMSVFMKVNGHEVKFLEVEKKDIQEIVQQVEDLLRGKRQSVESQKQGIRVTKKGIEINYEVTKGFQAVEIRQIIPTLLGIPLDLHARASMVTKMEAQIKTDLKPGLFKLLGLNSVNSKVIATPRLSLSVEARMGVQTPFARVGLHYNTQLQSEHKIDTSVELNIQEERFEVKQPLPKKQLNVFNIRSKVQGFSESQRTKGEVTRKAIDIEVKQDGLIRVERQCSGQDLFGIELCARGKIPDLNKLGSPRYALFPTILLTNLIVSSRQAQDQPDAVVLEGKMEKWDKKEIEMISKISASSKTVTREIKLSYHDDRQEKQIRLHSEIKAPRWPDKYQVVITGSFKDLKNMRINGRYGADGKEFTFYVHSLTEKDGKRLRVMTGWNKLPREIKMRLLRNQFRIFNVLQQYFTVRPALNPLNKITFVVEMEQPQMCRFKVRAPTAVMERENIPVPFERFPTSRLELQWTRRSYLGSWCILKGSELTTFDKKKIPCDPKAPCTYILTEDRKENWRVELEMKTPKRRIIRFTTKRMTRQIEMFPDLTVRVNGKPATMPFTFDKAQMRVAADLRQWNLKTLYLRYIEVFPVMEMAFDGQNVYIWTTPMYRSHLKGMCGDHNGEQWNELQTSDGQVLSEQSRDSIEKYIKSWRRGKC